MVRSFSAVTAVLLVLMLLFAFSNADRDRQPSQIQDGVACVSGVIDPLTFTVDGLDYPVRMAGVKADLSPPLQRRAVLLVQEILDQAGCLVWLEPAQPAWDERAGVYRAWVWFEFPPTEWYLLQRSIVWYGLAELDEHDAEVPYYRQLIRDAELAAQAGGRGIWPPLPQPTPTPRPPSPTPAPATPAPPAATPTVSPSPTPMPPSVATPIPPTATPPAPGSFISPPPPSTPTPTPTLTP